MPLLFLSGTLAQSSSSNKNCWIRVWDMDGDKIDDDNEHEGGNIDPYAKVCVKKSWGYDCICRGDTDWNDDTPFWKDDKCHIDHYDYIQLWVYDDDSKTDGHDDDLGKTPDIYTGDWECSHSCDDDGEGWPSDTERIWLDREPHGSHYIEWKYCCEC